MEQRGNLEAGGDRPGRRMRSGILLHIVLGLAFSVSPARALEDPEALARAAEALLAEKRPWRATELLDSALRVPSAAPRQLVLLGARAAAGWGGWSRVQQLLAAAPWLDQGDGEAYQLLARAALSRGQHPAAAAWARRSVAMASADARGERLLLLARALDRLERRDSAALLYLEAAASLPSVRDWLMLRAAGVTDDLAARRALLARVEHPPAVARVPWTNALGSERARQFAEAARIYDSVGARITALRARLESPDSARRAEWRRRLLDLFSGPLGPGDTRVAISVLDRHFKDLGAAEQLAVARKAAAAGLPGRAVTGFAGADRAGLLTGEDRYAYASALAGAGQHDAAIGQFARVRDSAWRPRAQYQRARTMMLAGQVPGALGALKAVAELFSGDTVAAATALYLAGDLRTDRGEDSAARAAFLTLGRRYPGSGFAPQARLRAALSAFREGRLGTAAAELDALGADPLGRRERMAAAYWAGRAHAALGDSAAARGRWEHVAAGSDDYYAILASRRLDRVFWRAPAAVGRSPVPAALRGAVARSELLERLGLEVEAGYEWSALLETAAGIDAGYAVAALLDSLGHSGRAYRLALRLQAGRPLEDGRAARLLFPLPRLDALQGEAAVHDLDPMLVAALIRQESAFDPRARSGADARGLMQMLPSVGASQARAVGLREWDPVLLYEPDVNLRLGTRHLASVARQYGPLEHVLAAYNAGGSRVERWLRTGGVAEDPELFVERIPYVETRDYVRRVLVNLARYEALYRVSRGPGTENAPGLVR